MPIPAEAGMNKRTINQFIIGDVCESCQLAMGMTELAEGSGWNTLRFYGRELYLLCSHSNINTLFVSQFVLFAVKGDDACE